MGRKLTMRVLIVLLFLATPVCAQNLSLTAEHSPPASFNKEGDHKLASSLEQVG